MNKTAIILISLAILAAGLIYVRKEAKEDSSAQAQIFDKAAENFNSWQSFKPRSGLFKVMLPHPPQYAKDLVPIPGSDQMRRYDMYASEKIDGTLFLISVITYPTEAEASESAEILKQIVEELMRSKPDNHLSNKKESRFKSYPALDFTIANQGFRVEGKVFMVGKAVYVLSYITRKDGFNKAEFQHFIDSFELTDDQPPAEAEP